MKEKVIISPAFKIVMLLLTGIGVLTIAIGIFTEPVETWTGYLVTSYYFFSLAIGALFFLAIQYVSQSGWSSAFSRVPEAMMTYMPVAALSFFLLWFGIKDLYKWANEATSLAEPVIEHKSIYLNIPFFFIRMFIYFAAWVVLCYILREISRKSDIVDPQDTTGIMRLFAKSELWSKIVLFVLALTFSLSSIDWLLSINPDWYSTIFALKNLVGAILHGVSIIALIVFILYKLGYYPFLNKYHLHDFARYIFMFSIIWGYFWFAQYMIIWYGNIPDETLYYYVRWQTDWKIVFFTELGLNWFIPFMVLLPVQTSRNMTVIFFVIIILIVGQYVDLFFQVAPVTTGLIKFGWIEGGIFAGYAGLFSFVVASALGRLGLYPKNHPYLEESLHHSFK